jgi:transposase-like protein
VGFDQGGKTLGEVMMADHRRLQFDIGTDKHASSPEAFVAPVKERILPSVCQPRRVKYLNDIIEQDHRPFAGGGGRGR